ncbi:hypothetical protein F5X98DRAFT_372007 [Xylaria grammica]|nr:hypothetical protein F5X98DRAFT_372007 [Xylaria grammica]
MSSPAGDYEGMEIMYTDDMIWSQLDDLVRELEAANEVSAREPFTEVDYAVPQIESSGADDSKLLFNSSELDDEEVDIEEIFDLEQASLSDTSGSSSAYIGDNAILGFVPIVGRKEDPYTEWLNKAIKGENDSGGVGPFVFPHSPAVFMSSAKEAAEKLEKFNPLPPTPPTPPAPLTPLFPPTPPSNINKQSINRAGGPRSQIVRAMPPAPPTYAGQQPNVAYNNPQLNVAYNNFQPSLAYGPQTSVARGAQGQNWAYGAHNQNAWVVPPGPQMYTHGQPNMIHNPQPNVAYAPQFQSAQPLIQRRQQQQQLPTYRQGHQNLIYDPQTHTHRYVTYV